MHLYGCAAEMAPILDFAGRHGLAVIEDCAQAAGGVYDGRRVGGLGRIGCFSFYPTKNLGALGDAGLCATDDPALAARLRRLRQYGWRKRQVSEEPGLNSRLDSLQAAVLLNRLPRLDAENARRQVIAAGYDAAFAGLPLAAQACTAKAPSVHHLYVRRTAQRDALQAHLRAQAIAAEVHYQTPLHQQPGYRDRLAVAGKLAETERAAAEVLSLPIHPRLTGAQAARVIAAVESFFHG